ncbi:sensor histidine kinase [Radiobacillus sp. PE A8.2]|uniref:sensor histidine kinase n=1 Tax=Radiobacillus sp. PE A8.2 TaxID=3380349 RepID=UPI00388F4CA0
MRRHWGLKQQFLTVFLLFITLPTILFGTLIYYQATKAFKHQAEVNTTARLNKNDENLASIISEIENMTSYMIYDDSFRTFFTASKNKIQQIRQSEEDIRGYLTFQLTSYDYVDSILLRGSLGNTLHFGNPISADEQVLDEKMQQTEGKPFWSDSYKVTSDWAGTNTVVSLSRMINDINDIAQPIGMARIRLDGSKFYQAIEAEASHQQGDYFIINSSGEVVLHPEQSLIGKPFPDSRVIQMVENQEQSTVTFKTDNDTYLLTKNKINGTDWYSVILVNESEVVEGLYNVRSLITNMIILLIILGGIAFVGFYVFNIKRIIELTDQTKQLEGGDFSAKVEVSSQDEIGRLGLSFNKMVIMLEKHIESEYKLKIKQKESELKALQNQIDPHFLYNTLDMIRWTARLENAMETGQQIERLSNIFRMSLNMGKMWVRLEEEVQYIKNYLELQKNRLGDRLRFSIYIDDQIKNVYVMKQLLQPLVENSIKHGFKDLPRQGVIAIRCYKVKDKVIFEVADNGWGFDQTSAEKGFDNHEGYALANIEDRLSIAFGNQSELSVLDTQLGATVQITIPELNKEKIKGIRKELGE